MLTGAVALKEDDLQFISGEAGDIPAENPGDMGMYYRDTRFLNRYELTINDHPPVFLSNTATKHYIATFQYINPNLTLADGRKVRQQTISIRRSRFVTARGMHERIGVLNCNRFEVTLDLVLTFDADFRDMFSIRGFKTQHVAGEISVRFGAENLVFQYRGRDAVTRTTGVAFDRPAEAISSKQVRFTFTLPPQQFDTVVIRIQPDIGRRSRAVAPDFDGQLERLAASYKRWDATSTSIESNNEMFDREVLRASRYDIRGLLESTPHGLFPHAGVPWYAVPFGRDAIITSLQTLIYNPSIAEGTLRFLAAYQGNEVNPFREEEPGKIMHELRRGELASLGEVPHTPYFGTVDATPLFLILFVETMRWLNSDGLYADVLPAVMRALSWIDDYGDLDGDGYVEYIAHRPGGVVNQGWKDSADAVQNSDGSNAIPPVALIEVQGYVYQAKVGLAALFRGRGDAELADRLEREAKELKRNFNRDFWMEGESYFAQALDRDKAQIQSVTSNPGHCLWAGICDDDKARALADRLLQDDMFSGWGIRTLSTKSANYNPMSYHNGSVWPHDTALIALGLRHAGFDDHANRLVTSLIEAGFHFSDSRLPELFCGFTRDKRFNSHPTAYVVSCSPQAWAAGCVFMLIQTILDLRPDLPQHRVHLSPMLPDVFKRISLRNLSLGTFRGEIALEGAGREVRTRVLGLDEFDVQAPG